MTQPGSFRDSAESFSKVAATSDSRPTFAIQVTANTTIRRSVLFRAAPERGSDFEEIVVSLKRYPDTNQVLSSSSILARLQIPVPKLSVHDRGRWKSFPPALRFPFRCSAGSRGRP